MAEVSGKILFKQGEWVVTDLGIECTSVGYSIGKDRLRETDWVAHVGEKTWVNEADFEAVYNMAIKIHG